MGANIRGYLLRARWRFFQLLHTLDYALCLPILARFPLPLGYALSALRGRLNGLVGRNWRSMYWQSREIARRSAACYRTLLPRADAHQIQSLVRERFATESREEFEARLIIAGRVPGLHCDIAPDEFLNRCLRRDRGLVLLTPHFDSFILGVVFLGRAGVTINLMSSLGNDPYLFNPAVYRHFLQKYQSMEPYLNGGRVVPMENGSRPFYQMLSRGECVVILGDVPLAGGNKSAATPLFLGQRRQLSGGALRMARKSGADIGAFVCCHDTNSRSDRSYHLSGSSIKSAADPDALDNAYAFLGRHIEAAPGRWWAADLLIDMPCAEPAQP